MGRHGYSDDLEPLDLGRWRGQVASAIRGKRGQAFLRALVSALDAMPRKELAEGKLVAEDGSVCALGCLGLAKGYGMRGVETEDYDKLGELFNIAPQLAQEVMYMNDEGGFRGFPEERWKTVRDWAARQIHPLQPDADRGRR